MEMPGLVRDIMAPDPARCTPHATLDEVAGLMVERERNEILVVDSADRPVGIITNRDIVSRVVAKGKNPLAHVATNCMSMPVVTVGEDAPLDQVLSLAARHQIRRVAVVDKTGCCVGIVSADAASASRRG